MGRSISSSQRTNAGGVGRGLLVRLMVAGFAGIVGTATTDVATAQVTGDTSPLAAAYGAGVHSYFAGDYARSHDILSDTIEAGTEDPRAWYFRGLAALRLGRTDEAEADFEEGAERESTRVAQWPVSRSLERVQGADRLQLERHRVRSRVAALRRDRESVRRRYSEIDDARSEALRRRRPLGTLDAGDAPFADPATPEAIPTPEAPAADDTPAATTDEPLTLESDPFDTK